MLITVSMAFSYCAGAQNIIANSDFNDMMKCCEYNKQHLQGWYDVGSSHFRIKEKGKSYLKAYCYNDTNHQYVVTVAWLIKPMKEGRKYKLKITLKEKNTFNLYYACIQQRIFKSDVDTGAFSSVAFKKNTIDRRVVELEINPDTDSCNYIAFKFEDIQNDINRTTILLIDSIELIDATETKKRVLQNYYSQIKEIYADKRRHDYTAPCNGNRTLNQN